MRTAIFSLEYGPAEAAFSLLTGKEPASPKAYVSGVATGDFPDPRLFRLAQLCSSSKITPDRAEFHCFVGMATGWSDSRASDIFAHLKIYDSFLMVAQSPAEAEDLISRLILTDLEAVERIIPRLKKLVAAGTQKPEHLETLRAMAAHLESGKPISAMQLNKAQQSLAKGYGLLSLKPALLILPEGEVPGFKVLNLDLVFAKELVDIEGPDAQQIRQELGLEDPVPKVFRELYNAAGLIHFFTLGPKEAREWPVPRSSLAPEAAGKIHSDMQKRFIRALVASWEDVIKAGGWEKAKKAGVARSQGKSYEVKDGDVLEILF